MTSQSQRRPRSNTNTEENELQTALWDYHTLHNSSSESDGSDLETRHASMSKHVRKRVLTNEKRQRKLKVKFKTFVPSDELNSKHLSPKEKTATLPASFKKRSWGGKKLTFHGMEAFVGRPRSLSTNEQTMHSLTKATDAEDTALTLLDPLADERSAKTQASEYLERNTIHSENSSEDSTCAI